MRCKFMEGVSPETAHAAKPAALKLFNSLISEQVAAGWRGWTTKGLR